METTDDVARIDERDVRVDCYVAGTRWSMSMMHLPTGIQIGPVNGTGSRVMGRICLLANLARLVAEARK